MEDYINKKVKMIKEGCELSQIRSEVWHYFLNKHCTSLRLDSIIDYSMELYAEIVKRAGSQNSI